MLHSIKNKILLSHLSIILITALTLGGISYELLVRSLREVQQDKMVQTAGYEARALDSFFIDTIDVMQRLSQGKAVSVYCLYDEENALFEYFLKFKEIFPLLIYAGPDEIEHIRVFAGKPSYEHNRTAYPTIFEKAANHPNEVVFAGPVPLPELGEPGVFFAIARHNYFDEFSGVILGAVPLSTITAGLSGINMNKDSHAVSYLLDPDGTILSGPDPRHIMTRMPLPGIELREFIRRSGPPDRAFFSRAVLMGSDSFIACRRTAFSEWTVAICLPYEDFITPLDTLRTTVTTITCLIIAISSIIALTLSKGITRALNQMIRITESVAGGNLSERLRITSKDELGVLSRHFNRMIADLDSSRSEIVNTKDRLQNIISSMMDALMVLDPQLTIMMVNASACELLKYSEDELCGKPVSMIFAPGTEGIRTADENGGIRNREMTLRSGTGEIIEALFSGSVIRDEADIQGVVCVFRDITDRKRMEEKLRESEHKYRSLLERANDGIIILQDTIIRYANPQVTHMLGYSLSEIQGESIDQIMEPEERNLLLNIFSYSTTLDRAIPIQETRLVDKNSRAINVEINTGLITFQNRQAYLLIIRDITERLQLQKERLKAGKLESIGILAGGIAHDYNNILTGILGNISLAKLYIQEGNKAIEKLTESEKAVSRAKDLTARLSTFAKGGAPRKQVLHIGSFIRDALPSVLQDTSIDTRFHIAGDLWLIEADPEQMSRVFRNLLLNAVEAMPGGGILDISAENLPAADREVVPDSLLDYIKISVTDHGRGIAEHHLDKIFDPYFSTKQRGTQKGMGLGLAIAHSIITRHGGMITVRSQVGKGTTFDLFLPATRS